MRVKILTKSTGKIREVELLPNQVLTISKDEQLMVPEGYVVSREGDTVLLRDPTETSSTPTSTVRLEDTDGGLYFTDGGSSAAAGGVAASSGMIWAAWGLGAAAIAAASQNGGGNSAGGSVTPPQDSTAPGSPIISGVSEDTGTEGDQVTNDPTITLSGTAEPSSRITIFDGTTELGSAIADANGNWTFTTPALSDGPHQLSSTATDAAGNTSVASNAVAVTIDTTAPAAGTLTLSGREGDQDGSFTLVSSGAEEDADIAYEVSTDGGATWTTTTPAQTNLAPGSYSFRGVVTDAAGNQSFTAAQAVTVAAVDVNDAPVAVADTATVAEDTVGGVLIDVLANDTDADNLVGPANAGLTITNVTVPAAQGVAVVENGQIRFTPAANFNGTATISYTANDGTVDSAVQTVTVTVTPVADAPVAVNDTASATEAGGTNNGTPGTNPSGNVLTNDTDVDTAAVNLTVSAFRTGATEGAGTAGVVGGVALAGLYGTLTMGATGAYTYTVNNADATVNALAAGATLIDNFNYTVSDGALTDTAVLAVTITGANDGPASVSGNALTLVTNAGNAVGANGGQVQFSEAALAAYFTDPEGQALGINTVTGVTGLTNATTGGTSLGGGANVAAVGTITIDDDGTAGGTFSVVATDAAGALSPVTTVTLVNNVTNTLNAAAAGNSIIVADQNQATTLNGGAGNDYLIGNNDNDTLSGGAGNDVLDGRGGLDTASYATALAAVTVSLAIATPQATGGAGTDTLISIENLTGSANNDTLTGNANANVINGGAGNDRITGGGGDDTLDGGANNDTYVYAVGDGNDTITDASGSDTLEINGNNAPFTNLAFRDNNAIGTGDALAVTVNGSTVTVNGQFAGNDNGSQPVLEFVTFTGGASYLGYALDGTYAVSAMDMGNTPRTATFASGSNIIAGEDGTPDSLTGGTGTDLIFGDSGDDTLNGGGGNDLLLGGAGVDTLNGDAGNDTLVGGAGNDTINAGGVTDQDVIAYLAVANGTDTASNGLDTITNFDGDAAGGQDIINLDALFDSLGRSNADRAAGAGFTVVGGVLFIDLDNNNGTSGSGAAGGFEYRLASVTAVSGTFDTADVVAGTI